jgi:hypothetical protein
MSEVHPEESAHHASEKDATGKGKNSFFQKHKILIFSGIGLVLVVLYLVMRSNSANAQTSQAASGTAASAAQQPAVEYSGGGGGDGGQYASDIASQVASDLGASLATSPTSVTSAGGSTTTATTPVVNSGSTSTATASPAPQKITVTPNYAPITFAQAQALAGKSGSSQLYYGSGNNIVQGKYANDPNVQYFIKK